MSTAASTRAAVRSHPFLLMALRAGVLNYTAAARFLGIDDVDAGAAALRRFAAELPEYDPTAPDLRIRVESGIGPDSPDDDPLFVLDDTAIGATGGKWAVVRATGNLDPAAVARIMARIDVADVDPIATGYTDDRIVVVVERSASPTVIQCMEGAPPRERGSTD